jgi:hypothetical protein
MTIPFDKIKAELLSDPEVKREYDALAQEFEAYAESLHARKNAATKAPNSSSVIEANPNLAPQR